ncbi:hypothetical protein QJS66_19950 [Kocuria rhizophila]|nr:hypothetical protein QJS66_19950 [Kocuria rhizophila]
MAPPSRPPRRALTPNQDCSTARIRSPGGARPPVRGTRAPTGRGLLPLFLAGSSWPRPWTARCPGASGSAGTRPRGTKRDLHAAAVLLRGRRRGPWWTSRGTASTCRGTTSTRC